MAQLGTRVSGDYLRLLKRVGRHEFSGDFRLLGARDLGLENSQRECPNVKLGEEWWLFAMSGAGDGWLIATKPGSAHIAFLDHDEESRAAARPLGIDFRQWLQLADLMAQVDSARKDARHLDERFRLVPRIRSRVRSAMAKISRRLPENYPYAL